MRNRPTSAPPKPVAGAATVPAIKPDLDVNARVLNDNGWLYQSTSPIDSGGSQGANSSRIINLPKSRSKHAFHNSVSAVASFDHKKYAVGRTNPFDKQTEVIVVDAKDRRASPIAMIGLKGAGLIAVSPDGGYVVTRRKGRGADKGAIDFWKISGSTAQHSASWETAGFHDRNGFAPAKAMYVGTSKLLTIGRNIALWDLSAAAAEYSIPLDKSLKTTAISYSGRELAICDGSDIVLVKVTDGNTLGRFTPPGSRTSSLAFSSGGQFLAGMSSTTGSIWVWDLESNELVQELGSPSRTGSIRWVGDRYLLASGQLIDIELRVPVWKYTIDGKLLDGENGSFWLVGKTKAAPVRLPHKDLEARIASLDPEQLLVLKPEPKSLLIFSCRFHLQSKSRFVIRWQEH